MISAAALLSSCGIYNKYERPEVNTTGLVRDVASATDTLAVTDTTSFGNLPWRSVFTDPQLQSIIEKGLANNTDMLNAALNVKMVEAQLTAAKLAFVPSFTFSPQEPSVLGTEARPQRPTRCPSTQAGASTCSAICSTRSAAHRWHCSPQKTISSSLRQIS